MILNRGLQRICDICLYLAFATFAGYFFGASGLLWTLPVMMVTAFLAAFMESRGFSPYLMLPIGLVSLLAVPPVTANWVILIPAIAYLGYGKILPTYENLIFIFKLAMKGLLILIVLVLATTLGQVGLWYQFTEQIIPFAMIFFWGYVFLLRMSRHEGSYTLTNRFKILNFLSLLGFVILGLFIAIPRLWGLLFNYLFRPVLLAAIYGIMWVLARAIPNFEFDFEPEVATWTLPECWNEELGKYTTCPLPDGLPTPEFNNQPSPFIFYIIAGVATLIALHHLAKKFKNRASLEDSQIGVTETRTTLMAPKAKRPKQRRHENPVRETYRQFLKYCTKHKLDIKTHMTSLEIETTAATNFEKPQSDSLRQLYLKTRYGGQSPEKADTQQAKELLKQIKK